LRHQEFIINFRAVVVDVNCAILTITYLAITDATVLR